MNKILKFGAVASVLFAQPALAGTPPTQTVFSDCTPFLIDNLASAAPEPGTWAMMIVGFGLAGATLRRRGKTARVTFA